MVDDNLNMILTEGLGGLLNNDCELDSIEGNNSNKFEEHDVTWFRKSWMKIHVLCILTKQLFTSLHVFSS